MARVETGALIFVLLVVLISGGLSLAMYLFQALGIYKMGKNMGFKAPWLSFIPIANSYALGRIAETYVKADGRPSAKFSKILLTLCIILEVIAIAFMVVAVVLVASEFITYNFYYEDVTDVSSSLMSVAGITMLIIGYFAILGVSIAYSIIAYIAHWRIFALYSPNNATLYLVLSIFFSFLSPIFLFMLRNNVPKFTAEQRMNMQ